MKQSILEKKLSHVGHLTICLFIVFFFPLFFGHVQWITGTLINFFLIYASLNFKKVEIIPFIFLPYFGMLLGGWLFSFFFLYMAPFIWLGNSTLVIVFNKLKNRNKALFIASFLKTLIIFSFALIFKNNITKTVFVTMGFMQFITAFSGGFLAVFLNDKLSK